MTSFSAVNDWQKAADWIRQTYGLVIYAANGFSMSENLAILRPSGWFSENFADFIQKYGFQTPLQGLNYPFPSPASLMRFIPGCSKAFTTRSQSLRFCLRFDKLHRIGQTIS